MAASTTRVNVDVLASQEQVKMEKMHHFEDALAANDKASIGGCVWCMNVVHACHESQGGHGVLPATTPTLGSRKRLLPLLTGETART
jgi:hypothetical protein